MLTSRLKGVICFECLAQWVRRMGGMAARAVRMKITPRLSVTVGGRHGVLSSPRDCCSGAFHGSCLSRAAWVAPWVILTLVF